MSDNQKSTTDQILDLLLDALAERQAARQPEPPVAEDQMETAVANSVAEIAEAAEQGENNEPNTLEAVADAVLAEPPLENLQPAEWEPEAEEIPAIIPEKLPSIHLEKMLYQLSAALFVLIILINIPLNRFGTNLARAMPDEQSIVVRDGLVFKGSGDEIYILEDGKKRWISSIDAFDYFGYRWSQVALVDDGFLEQFEDGRPIHVLLKCNTSPHVYVLEDGAKRWIDTITTFQIEGFVWEDVKIVNCNELRRLPDGLPIPEDAGDPPQP
ncbi:MAG: hypothetical protein AAF490_10410 [Chloroflexota bacterium]